MSAHGAPVRNLQKMPLSTRRSSTRGTPRGLFGSNGWITDHSKSVRSKRAISTSTVAEIESDRLAIENRLYGTMTYRLQPGCRSSRGRAGGVQRADPTTGDDAIVSRRCQGGVS